MHLFLIDPIMLRRLPALDLLLTEPQRDLLLRRLHSIRTVADVAADIDGEVAADGAWGGSERVGGAEESAAGLDDVLALPDHSADWTAAHVYMTVSVRGETRG